MSCLRRLGKKRAQVQNRILSREKAQSVGFMPEDRLPSGGGGNGEGQGCFYVRLKVREDVRLLAHDWESACDEKGGFLSVLWLPPQPLRNVCVVADGCTNAADRCIYRDKFFHRIQLPLVKDERYFLRVLEVFVQGPRFP